MHSPQELLDDACYPIPLVVRLSLPFVALGALVLGLLGALVRWLLEPLSYLAGSSLLAAYSRTCSMESDLSNNAC